VAVGWADRGTDRVPRDLGSGWAVVEDQAAGAAALAHQGAVGAVVPACGNRVVEPAAVVERVQAAVARVVEVEPAAGLDQGPAAVVERVQAAVAQVVEVDQVVALDQGAAAVVGAV